ncbi:MAG: hypothetical protein ACLTHL_07550 [Collinsella sp.]
MLEGILQGERVRQRLLPACPCSRPEHRPHATGAAPAMPRKNIAAADSDAADPMAGGEQLLDPASWA